MGPEETPPSQRQPDPVRGLGDTQGNGTETTRPPRYVDEALRGPWWQGPSNGLSIVEDAVKRPTPAEQGGGLW